MRGQPTKFWHLQSGDAVRALACLGIVAFHVATGALYVTGHLAGTNGDQTWITAWGQEGRYLLRTATTGFYLFFVLSGFLVAAPFVSAFVEGRPRPSFAKYFRNRAIRLLPAAWLMFAFVLVRHGTRDASFGELLAMFTFTDDHVDHPFSTLVGQTWTLRVDLTFYVLVPVAVLVAMRVAGRRLKTVEARRRLVWAGAAFTAFASLFVASQLGPDLGAARSPIALLCLFMPGVALSAVLSGRPKQPPHPRLQKACGTVALIGAVILVVVPRSVQLELHLLAVGIGASLALGGLILVEGLGGRPWGFFVSRPMRWLGARTYGVYLWHFALMSELYFIFRGTDGYTRAYFGLLPLVIAASIVVAALSFRFVEVPAMRLRNLKLSSLKLPGRRSGRPVPTDHHVAAAPGGHRLAGVEALRALAVLGVVIIHVATGAVFVTGHLIGRGGTTWPQEAFGTVGGWGLEGARVSGFVLFALTGFLVGRPFLEAFVLGRERPSLRAYARNRALRLFPAAWLALAFLYLAHGTRGASTGEILSSLTLTENWAPHPLESLMGHLWLLKVGLFFYILVPVVAVAATALLARRLGERGRRRAVYALLAAAAVGSLVYAEAVGGTLSRERSLPWALVGFVPGLALATALAGRRLEWRRPARAKLVAAAALAGGCVLAVIAGQSDDASPALGNAISATAAAMIVGAPLLLELGGAGAWRIFDNPVARWAGSRSYAFFLWHFLVMSELYPLFDSMEGYRVAFVLLLPLVLLVNAVLAELSWQLVEKPALRLRARRRRATAHVGPELAPVGGHTG